MFTGFGRGNYDPHVLNAAIREHTHWRINGNDVSEDELYSKFVGGEEQLRLIPITEANIRDTIQGW